MFLPFFFTTFTAVLLLLFTPVGAAPLPEISEVAERGLESRAVTVLSAASISNFTPFSQFARAAYCQPSQIKTWSCGGQSSSFHGPIRDLFAQPIGWIGACNALPKFQPTLTGGDGASVPFCEHALPSHVSRATFQGFVAYSRLFFIKFSSVIGRNRTL